MNNLGRVIERPLTGPEPGPVPKNIFVDVVNFFYLAFTQNKLLGWLITLFVLLVSVFILLRLRKIKNKNNEFK